ncbi:hypothetical protein KUTeg_020097 [Tegillarca granosa]|uniref:Uncharacterized protein n=1 Tax=Tegillarca granosa TaxID=220873 RepID=A0ABQ9ECC3_TEGGR|nr:hypothetical protein KUTeg_020097 [Tegillarca granosa]
MLILEVFAIKGLRRVNVLFKRGGSAARRHLLRLLEECNLLEKSTSKKILDETEGIDFLNHYRLVDPDKIENYARAFVVEDSDFDTILKSDVLHIDEATEVSFRMFAVISALCERVTSLE